MSNTSPKPAPVGVALIADPDAGTRGLYRTWLEGIGWHVEEAEDGREALVKALGTCPTLLITEIRLPFIDGCDLCQLLRRDAQTRAAHIVVVTAETRAARTEQARSAGANAIVAKPCTLEVFIDEMERLRECSSIAPDVAASPRPQRRQSRSYKRVATTRPPFVPPPLICPRCDAALHYESSQVGGASETQPEQWDYFACRGRCAPCRYEYRHRTKKLRHVF